MKFSPNDACPCGKPDKYKRCCKRFHDGTPVPDAESLMRARYSAYVVGDKRYIRTTTHPESPHHRDDIAAWDREIQGFIQGTRFLKLQVLTHLPGEFEAAVSFLVTMSREGKEATFGEHSRFQKVNGKWLYHSGQSFRPEG
jgi:SEC-C motif-containing protein